MNVRAAAAPRPSGADGYRELATLAALETLQRELHPVFLHVGPPPHLDRAGHWHAESGYPLPGLAAWPLRTEPWWQGGHRTWIARLLVHRASPTTSGHLAWVVTGAVVGRGADGESLVGDARTVAVLTPPLLAEAHEVYAAWRGRDFR